MNYLHGYPVVDGSHHEDPSMHGKGYTGRDYAAFPLGSLSCHAEPTDDKPLTPAEVKEAIAEKTAKKTWITDLCDLAGLTVKNQQQTNYCWINAPTHCVEINYVLQGGTKKVLSAACAGAQIMHYANQGGSGIVGVKWLAEHGVCTEAIWPRNAINPKYCTEEAKTNAHLHRVLAWEDIDPRDHDKIVRRILSDKPVTVGIPAWGHEVTITFLVWDNGPVFGIDNSWGPDWGQHGRGLLKGAYTNLDEAGCVLSVTPSVA